MIHVAYIKVGDYIIHKKLNNVLRDGTTVFYEKKRYRIIEIKKVDNIYVVFVDSEVGKYQLLFNANSYSPMENRYVFISKSEERINKIKSFL